MLLVSTTGGKSWFPMAVQSGMVNLQAVVTPLVGSEDEPLLVRPGKYPGSGPRLLDCICHVHHVT